MPREWDAASYNRLSNRQFGWGKRVLARLSLRGDETIIDAGCGSGRVTAELAALIPRGRVIAVDLSENMLRQAQANFRGIDENQNATQNVGPSASPGPPLGSEQISLRAGALARAHTDFLCADLAALPLTGVADGIFSTAAFHWVKDHDRLFQCLFAALKPGGWLEAQCGGGPNLARLRRRAMDLMVRPPYNEFFRGFAEPWHFEDDRSAAERLARTGFVGIATWLEPAGFTLSTKDEYRQYLATVTLHQHIARIPDPALRDRFLDDLAQQAISDPDFSLDYWRLNLHGRKPEA